MADLVASMSQRASARVQLVCKLSAAIARGVFDGEKRAELMARILEYQEYEQCLRALSNPQTRIDGGGQEQASIPLLVTTNRGLFYIRDREWLCLLPVTCFGVARFGKKVFVGASAGVHSFVMSAEVSNEASTPALKRVQILAKYETRYHNERIHQIAYDAEAGQIICANCRRNSLLVVDPNGRGIVGEKFLFVDGTGFPVYTDQNHINSVTAHGKMLLFVAHSVGQYSSAVGFVSDDVVRAYEYPGRGVHDVVIHQASVAFTDSFRTARNPSESGALRWQGKDYFSGATSLLSTNVVLRGLAMRGELAAVGYSAFASRGGRFADHGGGVIFVGTGGKTTAVSGPFSQVYDVLPINGVRSDDIGEVRSPEEMDIVLQRDVGRLMYEGRISDGAQLARLR